MNEQTQPKYAVLQDETEAEALLANMDAKTAAHLRNIRATAKAEAEDAKAQAEQGAEKWKAISGRLLKFIDEQQFTRWFKEVKPAFIPANDRQPPHLRLTFPTRFMRDWAENNYDTCISAIWQRMEPTGTLEFAIQPATDPALSMPAKAEPTAEKKGKIILFPTFPTEARPVVNELTRAALFPAIQGKDRRWMKRDVIAAQGDTVITFTGEQLNQDDQDVALQLMALAGGLPVGQYVVASAHSILTALERSTGKSQHEQLKASIRRLTEGSFEVKTSTYSYIGHLVDGAMQDKETRYWMFSINPLMLKLFTGDNYTLIDWKQRKKLRGKDLARWLQAYFATHAEPYPVKVETLWRLSGSGAKNLFHFRLRLRKALDDLKGNGDISAWEIDASDLVHVTRTPSPPQARHLIGKMTSSRGKGKGRKEKCYEP